MALSKLANVDDFDVHIYEAATKFGEIGAGIAMWPRVWEIMKVNSTYGHQRPADQPMSVSRSLGSIVILLLQLDCLRTRNLVVTFLSNHSKLCIDCQVNLG